MSETCHDPEPQNTKQGWLFKGGSLGGVGEYVRVSAETLDRAIERIENVIVLSKQMGASYFPAAILYNADIALTELKKLRGEG